MADSSVENFLTELAIQRRRQPAHRSMPTAATWCASRRWPPMSGPHRAEAPATAARPDATACPGTGAALHRPHPLGLAQLLRLAGAARRRSRSTRPTACARPSARAACPRRWASTRPRPCSTVRPPACPTTRCWLRDMRDVRAVLFLGPAPGRTGQPRLARRPRPRGRRSHRHRQAAEDAHRAGRRQGARRAEAWLAAPATCSGTSSRRSSSAATAPA
jgi:hypothetical protein